MIVTRGLGQSEVRSTILVTGGLGLGDLFEQFAQAMRLFISATEAVSVQTTASESL